MSSSVKFVVASGRPAVPLGYILAVTVSAVFSLVATTNDWILRQQPRTDPHSIALYEDMARKVKASSPQLKTIGYITDGPPESFYKFQYAMAPVLIISTPAEAVVLGYFPSTDAARVQQVLPAHGLRIASNLGSGLYVLVH